ncbi:unnamed protein product [Linum trigynum]|uniref:Uncharacterized protein n=1 Tax=Linum trigynum TaxID=586398 RepID=A0AAV2EGZ5_9ROSI
MSRNKASPTLSSFIGETGLGTPTMASAAMKVKEAGPLPPERVPPSRKEKEGDSALGLERRGVVLVFRVGWSGVVVLGLGEGVVLGLAGWGKGSFWVGLRGRFESGGGGRLAG